MVEIEYLKKLGLTGYEAKVYTHLILYDKAKARDISLGSKVPYGKIYDVLNLLIKKKIVFKIKAHPALFKALEPDYAIMLLIKKKEEELREINNDKKLFINSILTGKKIKKEETEDNVEVLTGADASYSITEHASGVTKKEKWIMTPRFIKRKPVLAVLKMMKKGVKSRLIVNIVCKENKANLREYLKLGGEIRLCKFMGMKLLIRDNFETTLVVENPKNKESFITILVCSSAFAKAMKTFYTEQWNLGKKIVLKDLN